MIWWWILFGLAGALLTNYFHELSHVVAAKINGAKVIEFKPWPHRYKGRWWMGRTKTYWPSRKHRSDTMIAPLIMAVYMAFIWLIIGHAYFLPLNMLGLWSLIDIGVWFKGYFFGDEQMDGYKWRHRKDKK